jgi:hypothetical protein
MRSGLSIVVIAVIGLFGATSIGYAAYVVSKDSVGLPVTKLKTPADRLAPKPAQARTTRPKRQSKPTQTVRTTPVPPPPTTTLEPGDDHGGRGRDNSGKGGGGGGDD